MFAAAVKWSLWLLLAAWLVLALAWGALHAFIVPRIGDLRPRLELAASEALGVPVRVGAIRAYSEGLIPSFELVDVVLHDPQGRPALRLPRVLAALSPRSLWHLGFEQIYIERPELDVRRTVGGGLFVAGLDFSRASDNEGRAADWFFSQAEFVIQGGTVRWTDELRGAPPLALSQVDIVVRNKARRHSLRLDATPPPDWGGRFTVTGQFRQPLLTASPGRWQHWDGQLHADFSAVDLSQLRHYVQLGFDMDQGRGRVRAWADVEQGQVVGGTADVALQDVRARLARELEPLELAALSGRLGGKRLLGGFQFETRALQFLTSDGQRWPGGNLALTWTGAEGQQAARGELQADRLDLAALRKIASRLPLDPTTHAALATHAPEGLVETLQARWQGEPGALQKYEVRGRASGLALAAQAAADGSVGIPGLRGAALEFDFSEAGGKARLAIADGALDLPGVFAEPVLPLTQLAADAQWRIDGERIALTVSELKFANADAAGSGRASWRTGDPGRGRDRFPGELELQGSLSRADGTRVWRYLPLAVPEEARDYVRESVLAGRASDVKFRVRGPLAEFPFADGKQGEFLITAPVRDVSFAYVPRSMQDDPAWPGLTQLSAQLVFRGAGMEIRQARGRVEGPHRLTLQADGQIPDFELTRVKVQGRVQGPLADALAFVRGSPLDAMLEGALAQASGTGDAEVDLRLDLPVHEIERSRVQGTVTLAGNDVRITPDSPLLARARGAVLFSEQGFQLAGVQARALGGEVRLEGGSRPTARGPLHVQLRAQGQASAEGLRQARELGFVSRLAQDFSGATNYQLALTIRAGRPEIQLASNLQGLAIQLPEPLGKPAEAALPLRYEAVLTPDSLAADAPQHELLALELGEIASVAYELDVSGPQAQVLRGRIAVGLASDESVPMPESGVLANVQLGRFDVDAWQQALARVAGAGGLATAQAPPRGEPGPILGYLPTQLALRARQLDVDGRTLNNVVAGGAREGRLWRANVEADELNGYLEYRQPAGAGAGRLHARLVRLRLEESTASEVEALLEQQPASIPALDIVVDDFELKGRKLGRLEIDAVNRGAGALAREAGAREWRLNRLILQMPEAQFNASGNWAAIDALSGAAPPPAGEARRTAIRFNLEIADAGALLARFGMEDVVRRGKGRMEGTVAWVGSPMDLDYRSMSGSFNVNVESGQFLKAEPGLAKLLGVLSLQSLPRRLALDFRDVFSEGFSFDFLRGDVTIAQGVAATNNLQMKGVNAAVLMEGRADLARETQDLKVVVVPEINAGTASLVASVINPAVGLGSFLAQMFLREPLARAATQEFHIDGTWADPRVTKLARGAAPSPADQAGREGAVSGNSAAPR